MTTFPKDRKQIMQMPRVRDTGGWSAFDRQHRLKNGQLDDSSSDPFPPISNATRVGPTSIPPKMKSFSSVVRPCNEKDDVLKNNSNLGSSNKPVKLLRDMFNWADESLIQDILAGVNNDSNKASEILNSIVSNHFEPGDTSSSHDNSNFNADNSNIILMEESSSDRANMIINGNNDVPNFPRLSSIPIEPEWEEDENDVYYVHRKDALKLMRAASNHSRAASKAFTRGDHSSARQLSKQAQEKWAEAEKLNIKAAEEILKIKNANNDLWNLDLHGLHASESVHAVEQRLYKLESGPISKTVLYVITGSGTHSKGGASLPGAVRTFLLDKRYWFEERPGFFAVHLKFRQFLSKQLPTSNTEQPPYPEASMP